MNDLETFTLPALNDNYIFLIRNHAEESTVVVDPCLAPPVLDFLSKKKWSLDFIWNTHHHHDHIGGNLELKKQTGCKVFGSASDASRIPGIDQQLDDFETFTWAGNEVLTKEVFGHTIGHIAFYIANSNSLFSGDTVFSLGCGRLFEGTAQQMWDSLSWISSLPPETQIYCTHEYTLANAAFAQSLESQNPTLNNYVKVLKERFRTQNGCTIPALLRDELLSNPFLRSHQEEFKKFLNLEHLPDYKVFAELRKAKDTFTSP